MSVSLFHERLIIMTKLNKNLHLEDVLLLRVTEENIYNIYEEVFQLNNRKGNSYEKVNSIVGGTLYFCNNGL